MFGSVSAVLVLGTAPCDGSYPLGLRCGQKELRLANGIKIRCVLTGGLGEDVVQKHCYSLKETKTSPT